MKTARVGYILALFCCCTTKCDNQISTTVSGALPHTQQAESLSLSHRPYCGVVANIKSHGDGLFLTSHREIQQVDDDTKSLATALTSHREVDDDIKSLIEGRVLTASLPRIRQGRVGRPPPALPKTGINGHREQPPAHWIVDVCVHQCRVPEEACEERQQQRRSRRQGALNLQKQARVYGSHGYAYALVHKAAYTRSYIWLHIRTRSYSTCKTHRTCETSLKSRSRRALSFPRASGCRDPGARTGPSAVCC